MKSLNNMEWQYQEPLSEGQARELTKLTLAQSILEYARRGEQPPKELIELSQNMNRCRCATMPAKEKE